MKSIFITLIIAAGFTTAAIAWADDNDFSCATDPQCMHDKLDAQYKQFDRRQQEDQDDEEDEDELSPPCAKDDECQRTKIEARVRQMEQDQRFNRDNRNFPEPKVENGIRYERRYDYRRRD